MRVKYVKRILEDKQTLNVPKMQMLKIWFNDAHEVSSIMAREFSKAADGKWYLDRNYYQPDGALTTWAHVPGIDFLRWVMRSAFSDFGAIVI